MVRHGLVTDLLDRAKRCPRNDCASDYRIRQDKSLGSEWRARGVPCLSIDKFENIKNVDERARLKAELTHAAMARIMAPLREAGRTGVKMWCADGRERRVYPFVAAFVGDWPEQNLMACTNQGGCPVCKTPPFARTSSITGTES